MLLETSQPTDTTTTLSAQELLAGSSIIHEISIPSAILSPSIQIQEALATKVVRLRPLSLATMTLISKAARDDSSLVPVLMVKEAMVEPNLSVDRVRQMHIGLVHYLVSQINRISGLGEDGEVLEDTLNSPIGQTHLLLAKHFGWTPAQVSQLTPAQVGVYLAGIERLMEWEGTES
jgi:hypothetical protein